MFRKNSHLTALETRKRLLLVESEVNRAELLKELESLKSEFDRVKKEVYAVGSIASSAALVASAVSIFRRRFAKTATSGGLPKVSWISAALDGARTATWLFFKIKSLFRERD